MDSPKGLLTAPTTGQLTEAHASKTTQAEQIQEHPASQACQALAWAERVLGCPPNSAPPSPGNTLADYGQSTFKDLTLPLCN